MRKKLLLAFALATLSSLLLPRAVFAATCNGIETSMIECNDGDGANAIWVVIGSIINVLAVGVLIVAIIATIVAGIQYMSARDNQSQVAAARKRLINMIIGVVAYALMYVFFAFIIPGGVSGVNQQWEEASQKRAETTAREEQKQQQEEQKKEEEKQEEKQEEQQQQPASAVSFTIKEYKPAGYKNAYQITELSAGAVPYVYAPNGGKGMSASSAMSKLKGTQALVVANAGTFEKGGSATGTVIVNGSVLQSGSRCTTLVIGQNGKNPGWAESSISASSLVSGSGKYYDMNGNATSGKIYSGVTCFTPIIVGGKKADGSSSSFNFAKASGHYRNTRARQILCVKGSPSSPLYSIISNKNEGTTGGWNFNHMTKVALDYGCVFAYNLDGGGSTTTWTRNTTSDDFKRYGGSRSVPTYIVFTANNQPIN